MATTVAELQAIITADSSGFDAAVDAAGSKLQELGQAGTESGQKLSSAFGLTGDQMTKVGGLMAGLGAAITAPLVGAVKSAADFEFAMDAVDAALGGVDTQTMNDLAAQAQELGASSKFSSTEIAAAQEQLAKSGLTAEDLLGGATDAVVDLAAATGEDLAPAATAAAAAMNTFGLQGEDMSRVADIMTTAMNNSSATLPDLQRGINNLGPVLANQNKYLNDGEGAFMDTAAAIAYFNQFGLKAADVGVSLARGLSNLADPTSDAANEMARLGINAFDTEGNFIPLPDLFDQLNQQMSGMSDQSREAALGMIFGAEAADVMNEAIKHGADGMREIRDKMEEEGTAAKQAAIRQDNLKGSVEKLGGSIENLGQQMGEPLLEPLKNVADAATKVVDVMAGLPQPIQDFVTGMAAGTGGLMTFGGAALFGTGQVLKLNDQFSKAGLSLPKIAAKLGVAGLAIGAAFGVGLAAYETNFLGFRDAVDGAMETMGKKAEVFGNRFEASFNARKAQGANDLSAAIGGVGDALKVATGIDILPWTETAADSLQAFGDAFDSSFNASKEAGLNDMAAAADAFGDALLTATGVDVTKQMGQLSKGLQAFGDTWESNMKMGTDVADAFFNSLEAGLSMGGLGELAGGLSAARKAIGAFDKSMQDTANKGMSDAERMGNALVDMLDEITGQDVSGFFDNLGSELGRARDAAMAFGNELKQGNIPSALDGIFGTGTAAQDFFNSLGAGLRDVTNGLGDFKDDIGSLNMGAIAEDIGGAFDAIGTKIGEIDLGGKLQGVSNQLMDWFNSIGTDLFGGAKEGLHGIMVPIEGAIPKLAEGIGQAFAHLPELVGQKVQEVGNPFDAVGQWLQEGVQQIGEFFSPQEITGPNGLGGAPGGVSMESGISHVMTDIVDGIAGGVGQLPDMIGAKLDTLPNPMDTIGTWLQDSLQQVSEFFTGDQLQAGLGGTGAMTSGLNQMFDGMVQGIEDGMGHFAEGIANIPADVITNFKNAAGSVLGPIADFLFGGTLLDPIGAQAEEGTKTLGDPTALGKSFGTSLINTFKDPGFITGLNDSIKSLPPETFDATGVAMLGAINKSLGTAMTTAPIDKAAMDGATQTMGQQMVKVLADGLSTSLLDEDVGALFDPAAARFGSNFNASLGKAMTEDIIQPGATGPIMGDAANKIGGIGGQMVQTLADGLTTSLGDEDAAALFAPAVATFGTTFNTALGTAMTELPSTATGPVMGDAVQKIGGIGGQMVKTMADGLTTSLLDTDAAELFIPAANALGGTLSSAMQQATQQGAAQTGDQAPAGQQAAMGFGQQLVQGLATGLQTSIQDADPALFTPAINALGTQLGAAMSTAADQAPMQAGPTGVPIQVDTFGSTMVQGLATGLSDSITAADPALFVPVSNALGAQLGAAMSLASKGTTMAPGPTGVPTAVPEAANGLVQGLATGLTDSITAADPTIFAPVGSALGTQLGTALQTAMGEATPVSIPGIGGPAGGAAAPVGGIGQQMVQNLATGLTDSITTTQPEVFAPVGFALGQQLDTALSNAMLAAPSQTMGPGGMTSLGSTQFGGVGAQMLQSISQGLTSSIQTAPVENFAPVGQALGSKLAESLDAVMQGATFTGPTGGLGAGADIGAQMGQSVANMMSQGISQADFSTVGTDLSTKLGEALKTAVTDMGDAGSDIGNSISEMLKSAVSSADFTSVGTEIGTKLKEAIDKAIQEAATGISDAMSKITEAMNTAISDISTTISTAVSDVETAVNDLAAAVTGATQNVQSAVATMQSAVETASSEMQAAAQTAIEAINEIGPAAEAAASAVEGAMASIAAAIQQAAGAATAAASQIVGALNSIANAAAGIAGYAGQAGTPAPTGGGVPQAYEDPAPEGEALTQGFSDGMTQDYSPVQDAANDLADVAYEYLADAVGMGSPAKKFIPIGAAVSQGFMKGMLDDAKARLKSAIGKMAGAVSSAMGKIQSAMQSGMSRAHSMVQQAMGKTQKEAAAGGTAAGSAMASGMAEGTDKETKQAERAAERLWRKALHKLLKGKGEARFLGEEFAREFWEGLMTKAGKLNLTEALDSVDSITKGAKEFSQAMKFAQFVTEQAMEAAENAVEKVRAKIEGLKTQFDLVNSWIASLQGKLDGINAELDSIAKSDADAALEAAGQARIDAAQEALDLQKQITKELEKQFEIEFQAAHQAHIAAVQAGASAKVGLTPQSQAAAKQADYEAKLAKANATNNAIAQSKAQEEMLAKALAAVVKEVAAEAAARAAAAEAQRRADLAAEKAKLEAELAEAKRIADAIAKAQHDAQVEYTNTVIQESQKRIAQLEKELKRDKGDPEKVANDKAQIALEKQRVDLANQLADALAKQAAGGSPEEMAAINAQIDYLNEALKALDDVDVGAMLETIVGEMGAAATSLDTAATNLGKAAKSLGSMDVAAPAAEAASSVSSVGNSAAKATENISGMAKAYNDVMAKMAADGFEFQAKFKEMVAANQKTAEEGATAIGESLSTGITDKISAGGAALQQAMMDGITGATGAADGAAKTGATNIAQTFGQQMQEKMGTQLSEVHKQLLTGPDGIENPIMTDATQAAEKGGTAVGHGFGTQAKQGVDDKSDAFKTMVQKTVDTPIGNAKTAASKGGLDIGHNLGDGISQGVRDKAHQIGEDAAAIVRDAIAKAKNAGNIHSPSARMRKEVGQELGMGVVLGMRDTEGDIEKGANRLVHIPKIRPTQDGGVTGSRAGGSSNTTTIHIAHLELPGIHDPQQFIDAMENFARTNGVSSNRR